MNPRDLLNRGVKVAASLLCGGVFYSVWLAAYLLAHSHEITTVQTTLTLLAPLVTAAGFTAGLLLHARLTKSTEVGFFRIFPWPLVGCAVGAAAFYPIGAMLIVFGMLAVGAASVMLREVIALRRSA